MALILTNQNKEIIVDVEDYKAINNHSWGAHKYRETWYATRHSPKTGGGQKTVLMHRVIMGAKEGEQIDHINGNGLDNRRSNLRFCTHAENMRNSCIRKDNASGYKGVGWHKREGKWMARIRIHGKQVWLGSYTSPEDAGRAYDKAAITHFGEFAKLNFPKESTGE